jgi:DNA-binding response OmpR family regulator
MRAIRCHAPSILLIGLGLRLATKEVVTLLDAGADDYLVKPFSFAELSARIRALRRRSQRAADTELKIADLNMDRVRRRVERAGRTIELTTKEFSLLEFLMLHAGRKVSRAEILEHVWKTLPWPGSTNLVDVYIAYIRKKIDGHSPDKLIHTTRGVGYTVSAPEDLHSCRELQQRSEDQSALRG